MPAVVPWRSQLVSCLFFVFVFLLWSKTERSPKAVLHNCTQQSVVILASNPRSGMHCVHEVLRSGLIWLEKEWYSLDSSIGTYTSRDPSDSPRPSRAENTSRSHPAAPLHQIFQLLLKVLVVFFDHSSKVDINWEDSDAVPPSRLRCGAAHKWASPGGSGSLEVVFLD